MSKQIAGQEIVEQWTEWYVEYPDGELCCVEDEETADDIIRCAQMVRAKYKKKSRELFATEIADPE